MNLERPLLIYDGDCGFCRRCVERARAITAGRVEYRASQEVAAEFPDVTAADFDDSVQFIGLDGARSSGAMAVFRTLATATLAGRCLVWLHAHLPPLAAAFDGIYRFVGRNRRFFSRIA